MKRNKFHIVVLLYFSLILFKPVKLYAQSQFNETISKAIQNKFNALSDLNNLFEDSKRDTLKMRRLLIESQNSGYLEGEAYALNRLGISYTDISLYEKAIKYHQKANKQALQVKSNSLLVWSLNMEGIVYRRMNRLKPALDCNLEALRIMDTIINPSKDIKRSRSIAQNSIGNIYKTMEQYALAIEYFEASLKTSILLEDKTGLAVNYQNIGTCYEGLGNLDRALSEYQRSLSYGRQLKDSIKGKSICYNSIGVIYAKKKDFLKALDIINEALTMALDINDQFYISKSHSNLGLVYTQVEDFKKASYHLNKAISISKKHDIPLLNSEALLTRSILEKRKGNFEQALFDYQEATEIKNGILNTKSFHYIDDNDEKYHKELNINRFDALAQENKLISDRFNRFRLISLIGLCSLVLILIMGASFVNTRKLNNEKKILTLEQDILRAQMNPHFIFNSLNAIKLYMINNEKENAVYYLNKFSKLIRKILVASKEKNVSLEEELDTMELYMNIENIRFDNTINYHVKIDPTIPIKEIKVPSLFLQPFLENAIWHGLSSKVGDKCICICISKINSSHIRFTVEDNGVGREQASKNKDNILFKRKSVGISLTKERLHNFSKDYLDTYHFEIIDLKGEDGSPIGTKISIDLPVQRTKLVTTAAV